MKVIVILTAMLWYEGIGTTAQTDFTEMKFNTITECQEYVFLNKVELVDGLLEMHRVVDDKVFGPSRLSSFEFFCETKYKLEEETKEEDDKIIMEL